MKQMIWTVLLSGTLLAGCGDEGGNSKNENADSTHAEKSIGTSMDPLTQEEKAGGWQALFDGQSTTGWHTYGGGPAGTAWKASGGVLTLDTSTIKDGKIVGGGNLVTDEEFENFHLKLEWNISKNGNSGILFYVQEDTVKYKEPYFTGPEMQVLDNDGHPDAKIPKHRAGDLYDLIACSKETVKPPGEWNQAEIKCVNGKLDFFLNGENVVSTTMWDVNWNKMVAASKFKQWKDFAAFKKGRICLQDHDNAVQFRNIKLKKM